MVFEKIQTDQFEQVVFCSDSSVGLKGIIAIHSRVLGPATGGCRMWKYGSETEALTDVLRLSKGMTYKASLAGLNWGGAKAVLIGDPKKDKNPAMLKRYGEFVDRLGGHYITAKDVGISSEDLRIIKSKTSHVLGIEGDQGSSGDPSPSTALGVFHGIRSCAQFAFNSKSLKGMKVAVQGLGTVADSLVGHLLAEGAQVVGCDIDPAAVSRAANKHRIEIVSPEVIYDVDCDIFAPSALGASINRETIPRLKAKIIAGAANNQLATTEDGLELQRRGIVYAPDYAINAGGLINIYYEDTIRGEYHRQDAMDHVCRVGNTIQTILERAKSEGLPSGVIADRMAMERIHEAKK